MSVDDHDIRLTGLIKSDNERASSGQTFFTNIYRPLDDVWPVDKTRYRTCGLGIPDIHRALQLPLKTL